jgi:capsular exopolysaccharide synthesis family protein
MELLAYWKVLRQRLWQIILIVLVGGIGTASYIYNRTPQYEATTTLFLNSAVAKSVLGSLNRESVQSLANTYAEFMHTSSFAHRVVSELGIPFTEQEVDLSLSTKYVQDTQFFRITAVHKDAHIAQALANTAAQVLIAENTVRQQAEQQQIEAQHSPSESSSRQRRLELQKALEDELVVHNDQIKSLRAQIAQLLHSKHPEESDQSIQQLRDDLISRQSARVNVLNSLLRAQSDLEANSVSTVSNIDTAVIVDAAPLPTIPMARGTVQYTLLALIICFVLGLGITFLLEYLDYTVKNPEVLDEIYGMPLTGAVSNLSRRWWNRKAHVWQSAAMDPYSPVTEMFRAMRLGLQVADLDSPAQSLLVTSAVPQEGKTFVATNLAVSLAVSGSRVILVDADLRKPGLHEVFDLPLEPGFTNLLFASNDNLDAFLKRTSIENLWVLTCGTVPLRSAELLGAARVTAVMEQLLGCADIVIYDAPPAVTVSDARILAPRVDAVLQVVCARRTNIDLVLRCKATLERAGAHIIGPVLNKVNRRDLEEYTPYRGHYYSDQTALPRVLRWLLPQRGKFTRSPQIESVIDSESLEQADLGPQ